MAKPQTDPLQIVKQAIRSKNPGNLYFFHGEEMFLLRHYLEQLKLCVVDPLTESFNYHYINSENFSVLAFADAVENLPMMAERTMVVLDDVDLFKLPESDRDKAADILSDIPDYCTVVFTYETVVFKPDKRYTKLFDAVRCGQIIEFVKQSQRDLISWIQRHFMTKGKSIAPDLCAYLIEITDGTMTALAGEINKIAAFSGADNICKADIDAVTEPVLDAVSYRLTDQIASGDYGGALKTMQTLLKMQEEPLKVLGSIGGHIRKISTARTLLDNGKNYSDLMRICDIRSDYQAKKIFNAARHFSPDFCARATALIVETDHAIKTSLDDTERLLELLILRLAQEARNA